LWLFVIQHRDAVFHDALSEDTADMDGMIGAGGAVPGDGSGEFAGAGVEEENGAAFGGDNVEEHGEELPLERIDVTHRTDGGTYFEQSGESAREADCGGKSRERFRLQIEEIFRLELLCGEAEGGVIVELYGTTFGGGGGFRKKEEGRISDGDLVAEGENAFADGNAIDEGARGRVQIAQGEATGRFDDRTVLRGYSGIFEADCIGWVAADREGSGDGKGGVFPLSADDGESWEHDWGLG
jgi:hypothetical protein